MNILLIGSGGREHALAWKLAQSPLCKALYCAPGNAGIAQAAQCVQIAAEDSAALTRFAKEHAIDLVVVGPEGPLVDGLADRMKQTGFPVFGPSQAAARLEGSKGFMKDLCAKYDIPTAAYGRFSNLKQANDFIDRAGAPIVIKTDGLAAGKGVIIAQNAEEAKKAAADMLSGAAFGAAGKEIIIEEFLDGEELSFFALADGKTVLSAGSAQDHKRVGDNDTGPNTGGMGAYAPAHMMTPELERRIMERIIVPTINGMASEGCPFTGVLFAGIMLVRGEPILLEFNIRFGDPECQPLMMRLDGDLAQILHAAAHRKLAAIADKLRWKDETALCVVMAAKGYPGAYKKHTPLDTSKILESSNLKVFHAGTALDSKGGLVSAGGRVLGITALGANVAAAQKAAYAAVDKLIWPEGFCRRDIGGRAVAAGGTEMRKKSTSS